MKHHIKSPILKKFKREMWELRSQKMTIQYTYNGEILENDQVLMLNYGCSQQDKHGNNISSNDSSYSYYYRRRAENDPNEYYVFTIDLKGEPQHVYPITNKNLEFNKIEDTGKLILSWTTFNGDDCVLTIVPEKVVHCKGKNGKLTNSRYFSLTRQIKIKDSGRSKVRRVFDKDGNELSNNLAAIDRRRRRKEERERKKAEQGPIKPVAFPGKNGQKNFEKWKAEQERKKQENNNSKDKN